MLEFSGSGFEGRSRPRLGELLGFIAPAAPAASGHPHAAPADPPALEAPVGAPSPLTSTGFDPSAAPTMAMGTVPAISVRRAVAAVVAPATSRSHVVPSVVAPATSRSTSPAPPVAKLPRVVATPPVAPPPAVMSSPASASTSAARTLVKAPDRLPADGGIFVGSQSPRRPGSLVSRVRRRQAADQEPEAATPEPPVQEGVTVISRNPRLDPAPAPWTPPSPPDRVPQPGPDWGSETRIEMSNGDEPRDLAAAARKTALMVGSRAREALLGYGFPSAEAPRTGAPYAGEEPAPGHTVVLEGDDVEAWVRERLYGGRLPTR
ncbi:MAG TPA: hypothetical protein VG295_01670 [Solirubrobacteraceae bacterium]|nr:hypothetical protein [Solirubrobacteraceae bacterium]